MILLLHNPEETKKIMVNTEHMTFMRNLDYAGATVHMIDGKSFDIFEDVDFVGKAMFGNDWVPE